tara:strand:- start:2328 stop:2684 length:357 start_codon:yes stop_codon:yes gene_type:complete
MLFVSKIALTQHSTIDSLRVVLAKAQYIALQSDSALNVYYDIQLELGKTIEASRIEINRYIKQNKELRVNNTDLLKELVKTNNKLARAKKKNTTWFIIGAGVGIAIETIGLIIGVILK